MTSSLITREVVTCKNNASVVMGSVLLELCSNFSIHSLCHYCACVNSSFTSYFLRERNNVCAYIISNSGLSYWTFWQNEEKLSRLFNTCNTFLDFGGMIQKDVTNYITSFGFYLPGIKICMLGKNDIIYYVVWIILHHMDIEDFNILFHYILNKKNKVLQQKIFELLYEIYIPTYWNL